MWPIEINLPCMFSCLQFFDANMAEVFIHENAGGMCCKIDARKEFAVSAKLCENRKKFECFKHYLDTT